MLSAGNDRDGFPDVRSLLDPRCFPHPVDHVELIETHISWVLLAGDYAYKLKKPVDLGFLDFSTLERRAHFCAEELRINRRLAPDLYLDVVTPLPLAIKFAYDMVGPDKLLYGSDHPWVDPALIRDSVKSLGLPAEDERKIFRDNAVKLLGL